MTRVNMGWRYRRSIRLPGGFRVNVSQRGVGYSWGVRGARFGRDASGRRYKSYSIPGTGLYSRSSSRKEQRYQDGGGLFWKCVGLGFLLGLMQESPGLGCLLILAIPLAVLGIALSLLQQLLGAALGPVLVAAGVGWLAVIIFHHFHFSLGRGEQIAQDADLSGAGPAPSSPFWLSHGSVAEEYARLHHEIEAAKESGDYATALASARRTFQILPRFVDSWKKEHGSFTLVSSAAVSTAGSLMALTGDRKGIEELARVLSERPELERWLPTAQAAAHDADAVDVILDLVKREPGIVQADLKRELLDDGGHVAVLAAGLEKVGRIRREPHGRTYRLFPVS